MEDLVAQVLKLISDCVDSVNRFLDTFVLPECKRFIVVLYSIGIFLFFLRLYLVLQNQYPQPEGTFSFTSGDSAGFILSTEEQVLGPGIQTCLRLISAAFALFTNLVPLLFPFVISGFVNRMAGPQRWL